MIRLTRLDGAELYVNADLVATVESPDGTVVGLVDGTCLSVRERAAEVVAAVTEYRAAVLAVAERIAAQEREQPTPAPPRLVALRPRDPEQ